MDDDFFFDDYADEESEVRPTDPQVVLARTELLAHFRKHSERVFYTKQIEILFEDRFFHWVTNRAIHDLVDDGEIKTDVAKLAIGVEINGWRRSWARHRCSWSG